MNAGCIQAAAAAAVAAGCGRTPAGFGWYDGIGNDGGGGGCGILKRRFDDGESGKPKLFHNVYGKAIENKYVFNYYFK